jgi:hypothetical protein
LIFARTVLPLVKPVVGKFDGKILQILAATIPTVRYEQAVQVTKTSRFSRPRLGNGVINSRLKSVKLSEGTRFFFILVALFNGEKNSVEPSLLALTILKNNKRNYMLFAAPFNICRQL